MHSSGICIDLQQSQHLGDSSQLHVSENISSCLENIAILPIHSSGLTIYQDSGLSHLYHYIKMAPVTSKILPKHISYIVKRNNNSRTSHKNN